MKKLTLVEVIARGISVAVAIQDNRSVDPKAVNPHARIIARYVQGWIKENRKRKRK